MREDIITYVKTLALGGFSLSSELPSDASGMPLYLKNPKKLYVDLDQITEEPIVQTLGGFNLNNEATTVSLYFTADAKQLPANYQSMVNSLRLGKDIVPAQGYTNRTVNVQTEYEEDMLLTRIDYTFSKIT